MRVLQCAQQSVPEQLDYPLRHGLSLSRFLRLGIEKCSRSHDVMAGSYACKGTFMRNCPISSLSSLAQAVARFRGGDFEGTLAKNRFVGCDKFPGDPLPSILCVDECSAFSTHCV
jgi:hypothetical protein